MCYDILLVSQLFEKIIFCWVLKLENERDGEREREDNGESLE